MMNERMAFRAEPDNVKRVFISLVMMALYFTDNAARVASIRSFYSSSPNGVFKFLSGLLFKCLGVLSVSDGIIC